MTKYAISKEEYKSVLINRHLRLKTEMRFLTEGLMSPDNISDDREAIFKKLNEP